MNLGLPPRYQSPQPPANKASGINLTRTPDVFGKKGEIGNSKRGAIKPDVWNKNSANAGAMDTMPRYSLLDQTPSKRIQIGDRKNTLQTVMSKKPPTPSKKPSAGLTTHKLSAGLFLNSLTDEPDMNGSFKAGAFGLPQVPQDRALARQNNLHKELLDKERLKLDALGHPTSYQVHYDGIAEAVDKYYAGTSDSGKAPGPGASPDLKNKEQAHKNYSYLVNTSNNMPRVKGPTQMTTYGVAYNANVPKKDRGYPVYKFNIKQGPKTEQTFKMTSKDNLQKLMDAIQVQQN